MIGVKNAAYFKYLAMQFMNLIMFPLWDSVNS